MKKIICVIVALVTALVFSGVALASDSKYYNASMTNYNDNSAFMTKTTETHFEDNNYGCYYDSTMTASDYESYFTDGSVRVSARHHIYNYGLWYEVNDYQGSCHLLLNNRYHNGTLLDLWGYEEIY